MKVLVLGGNGFIGSHIVDCLLAAGHQVRVMGRSPERYRKPLDQVEYYMGNFADTFQVAKALQGVHAVCHLISTTVPGTSNFDPMRDVKDNLVNTLSLLEQMRKRDIRKILYLSSGGTVYGNPKYSPIDEDHPLQPISSYGVVKLAIEKYLFMYQQLYGLQPIILRPSNPYGPRQGNAGVQGLIGTLLARVLADETLEVWGDGSIVRDYIYVTDLAKLCVLALEKGECGIFNAGSGKGHSIHQIITMIQTLSGNELDVHYSKGRSFDVKRVVLNIRRASEQFAWQTEVALPEGIRAHYDWLRNLS